MHRWWCPCTHTSHIQHWWSTPACSYPVSVAQLGHKSCTISMHNNMAICCHREQSNIITSRSIFSKILTTDLPKFPIRTRYRELLWIKIGCFASVIAVLNAIWSYIGLFNKEPQLYLVQTVEIKGGGYWGNLLHSVNFSGFFFRIVRTQMSLQLDTCQIWVGFKESYRYFCKIENVVYGEINKWSFSSPHPKVEGISSGYPFCK